MIPDLAAKEVPIRARQYYNLPENCSFRDLLLAVRADESIHREMNHYFCDLGPNEVAENYEDITVQNTEEHSKENHDSQ